MWSSFQWNLWVSVWIATAAYLIQCPLFTSKKKANSSSPCTCRNQQHISSVRGYSFCNPEFLGFPGCSICKSSGIFWVGRAPKSPERTSALGFGCFVFHLCSQNQNKKGILWNVSLFLLEKIAPWSSRWFEEISVALNLACSDLACSHLPCSDLACSYLACSDLGCFFCQNSQQYPHINQKNCPASIYKFSMKKDLLTQTYAPPKHHITFFKNQKSNATSQTPIQLLHFINILLSPNVCAFWDMETFLHSHPNFSALPNLTFMTSKTHPQPKMNQKSPKDPKSILILTMKLLYTYFWKTLPVGALTWLAPIWLIWAQIAQPTSNHLKTGTKTNPEKPRQQKPREFLGTKRIPLQFENISINSTTAHAIPFHKYMFQTANHASVAWVHPLPLGVSHLYAQPTVAPAWIGDGAKPAILAHSVLRNV